MGRQDLVITDADNREVLEYDGTTGAVKAWYAYGLGANEVLNRMDVASSTRQTMVPDVQGSIIGTLDSATGALTKTGYWPFGENPSLAAGSFNYTAQRLDSETSGSASQPSGLYYYRARMYSPTLGRFLQADPAGYDAGINLYAYVGNDPINRMDPSGQWAGVDDLIFFGGGALIGAGGQLVADVATNNYSHFWRGITSSAIGGGVAGEVTLYAGPVAGGVAGGLAANGTRAVWELKAGTFNETSIGERLGQTAFDAVTGGGLGYLFQGAGQVIPGISAGRNSFAAIGKSLETKFINGTISNVSTSAAAKWWLGSTVQDAAFESSALGSTLSGTFESVLHPESGSAIPVPQPRPNK